MTGQLFAARYSGRCASCEKRIAPGDHVGYADGELVCADCSPGDTSPGRARTPQVCGACHLTRPCDCEPTGPVT